MDGLSFLKEQLESVATALSETLRHDYGPERSASFYGECKSRLQAIRDSVDNEPEMGPTEISGNLEALSAVSQRVALIERSHLGEFSWPFAYAIEAIAERLFREKIAGRKGLFPPILHVIAEGVGYQILDDLVSPFKLRRILVVAFPRQLRHYVLLHSIFGHELGHPAQKVATTGRIFDKQILPSLQKSALKDTEEFGCWIARVDAPAAVRDFLKENPSWQGISNKALDDWRREIACDLFGLLLFGPAFAIAHRTILEPLYGPSREGDLTSTHPPFPLRRSLIVRAMRQLKWEAPVLGKAATRQMRAAETKMLSFALGSPLSEWASVISDKALATALDGIGKILRPYPQVTYARPDKAVLVEMLHRLSLCRPPVVQSINDDGSPNNQLIPIQHFLYAGWAFWFGREKLRETALKVRDDLPELTFLQLNRLCEQAILQQRAINLVLKGAA